MPQTFNFHEYTLDSGTAVAVKISSSAAGAAGCGWGSPSDAVPMAPKGLRMRQVYVLHAATGRKRAIPVATVAAYGALTSAGGTMTLPDDNSAAGTSWIVTSGRGEHLTVPHLIH